MIKKIIILCLLSSTVTFVAHAKRENFISINTGSNPFHVYNRYQKKSPITSIVESTLEVSGIQVGLGYNILDQEDYYGFFGIGVATFSGLQNYFYPLYLKYGYEFFRERSVSFGFESHLGVGMRWGDNTTIDYIKLVLDESLQRDYVTALSVFLQWNVGLIGFTVRAGVLPDRIYSESSEEPFDDFADDFGEDDFTDNLGLKISSSELKGIVAKYSFFQAGLSFYF